MRNADGVPIGECWLQKMNLPNVIAMYPETLDVRGIDMSIGEKEYWGKGIGTQAIDMMVDFAFCGKRSDLRESLRNRWLRSLRKENGSIIGRE